MRGRMFVIAVALAIIMAAGMLFRLRVMIAGGRFFLVILAVVVVVVLLFSADRGPDDQT